MPVGVRCGRGSNSSDCLRGRRAIVLKDKDYNVNGTHCHMRVSGIPKKNGGARSRRLVRQPLQRDCRSPSEPLREGSDVTVTLERPNTPSYTRTKNIRSPPLNIQVRPPPAYDAPRTSSPRVAPLQDGQSPTVNISYSNSSPRQRSRSSPRNLASSSRTSPRQDSCPLPTVLEDRDSYRRMTSSPRTRSASPTNITISRDAQSPSRPVTSTRVYEVGESSFTTVDPQRQVLGGVRTSTEELFSCDSHEVVSPNSRRHSPREGAVVTRHVSPASGAARSTSFTRRSEARVSTPVSVCTFG